MKKVSVAKATVKSVFCGVFCLAGLAMLIASVFVRYGALLFGVGAMLAAIFAYMFYDSLSDFPKEIDKSTLYEIRGEVIAVGNGKVIVEDDDCDQIALPIHAQYDFDSDTIYAFERRDTYVITARYKKLPDTPPADKPQ